jgi:hypothetical protein
MLDVPQRVAAELEGKVNHARRLTDRGYTHNERWLVRLDDGRSVFAKAAVDDLTVQWLRAERDVYATLKEPFVPEMLGWIESELPVLVIEDLSRALWPPPWNTERIERVRRGLEDVAAAQPPPNLPRLEELRDELWGWDQVAVDPKPFLSLGLCSPRWLGEALPALMEAAASASLIGDELLHLDVRSDNLCFFGDRFVLVDWNQACIGRAEADLVFWLLSLHSEGGPPPPRILPDAPPDLVALASGYFAARAGLPLMPHAPKVRVVQLEQLKVALPWVALSLGLQPPAPG